MHPRPFRDGKFPHCGGLRSGEIATNYAGSLREFNQQTCLFSFDRSPAEELPGPVNVNDEGGTGRQGDWAGADLVRELDASPDSSSLFGLPQKETGGMKRFGVEEAQDVIWSLLFLIGQLATYGRRSAIGDGGDRPEKRPRMEDAERPRSNGQYTISTSNSYVCELLSLSVSMH